MQAKDMALAEAQPADEPAPEPWDGTGLASSAGADSSVLGEAPTDPEGGGGGAGAAGGRREPPEPLPLEEPAGAFLDDLLRSLAAAPGRGGAEEDESASGRTESTLIRIHMKGRGCASAVPGAPFAARARRGALRPPCAPLPPPAQAALRVGLVLPAGHPARALGQRRPARHLHLAPARRAAAGHLPTPLPCVQESFASDAVCRRDSCHPRLCPSSAPRAPAGLLELGEQPHLVQWLKGRLEPYILTSPAPRGGTPHRRMPYESTLERAGERELVREIRRAGGFAAVALALGMRPSRRPVGFWEDLDNLALARSFCFTEPPLPLPSLPIRAAAPRRQPRAAAPSVPPPASLSQELAEFVFSAWVKLDDEDTGQTYFYNDLTGQVRPTAMNRRCAALSFLFSPGGSAGAGGKA